MSFLACLVTICLSIKVSAQQSENEFNIVHALEDIGFYSSGITRHIPNFHEYEYDDFISPATTIVNGRFDMYSVGNEIGFWVDNDSRPTVIVYGETYSGQRYKLSSAAIYPFTVLWWIERHSTNNNNTFQTRSFTATAGDGIADLIEGVVQLDNYRITYKAYQIAEAAPHPSICEVYFLFENLTDLMAVSPDRFILEAAGIPPYTISNKITLQGSHRRVLLGYTLYSKSNGSRVIKSEINAALNETLRTIIRSNSPSRPIPPAPTTPLRPDSEIMVEELIRNIENISSMITKQIPSWFAYTYDTINSEIEDGGEDMYDFGNKVRFKKENELFLRATYDMVYYFEDFQFYSRSIHPFISIMWIENPNGTSTSFTLQVDGNVGADQDGGINLYSGRNYEVNSFSYSYEVFQIHSAFDPSVCEVYFTVHSLQKWNSVPADTFEVVSFSDETDEIVNSVRVIGQPQRMLLGYMLLSKTNGIIISETEVRLALSTMVSSLGRATPAVTSTSTIDIDDITPTFTSQQTDLISVTDYHSNPGFTAIETLLQLYIPISFYITDNILRDWYAYQYDDVTIPINSIINGGTHLYDVGNQVYFYEDNKNANLAEYDKLYRFSNYDALTTTSYPFIGLLWIKNEERERHSYTLQVESNYDEHESGEPIMYKGTIKSGKSILDYWSYQTYHRRSNPNICEVYFAASNVMVWKSLLRYEVGFNFSRDARLVVNRVTVSGNPQNILMGYMLLSREQGEVSHSKIRSSLRRWLSRIYTELFRGPTVSIATSVTSDLDFLPGCTLTETMQSVLQCTQIFSVPLKYYDHKSCIKLLDCASNCVANQIEKCSLGEGENKLDSLNLTYFNSNYFIQSLRNLTMTSRLNDPISAFCHHAPTGRSYPHNSPSDVGACASNIWDVLLSHATTFYHEFAWARNSDDVCRSSQQLQNMLIRSVETLCSLDTLMGVDLVPNVRAYLIHVITVALNEVREFRFTPCIVNTMSTDGRSISESVTHYVAYKHRQFLQYDCSMNGICGDDLPEMCNKPIVGNITMV